MHTYINKFLQANRRAKEAGLWQEFLPTDDSGGTAIHTDILSLSFVGNRHASFIYQPRYFALPFSFAVGYSEKVYGPQFPSAEFMGFVRSVSASTERYSHDTDSTLPPLFNVSDVPIEVVHCQN